MGNRLEIKAGTQFGKLTVIGEGEKYILPSGQPNRSIKCKCECGTIKDIRLLHLVRGRIISCGCAVGEKHGDANTKLYKKWRAIKYRCYVSPYFNNYIENGITVCDEWDKSYTAFRDWALKNGYKEGLQIDRIDNNKGYAPDNCRFVTNIENVNNRNNTFKVIYKGVEHPFMQLVRQKQMVLHMNGIRRRLQSGMSGDEAFDKPFVKPPYRKAFTEEDEVRRLSEISKKRIRKPRKIIRFR